MVDGDLGVDHRQVGVEVAEPLDEIGPTDRGAESRVGSSCRGEEIIGNRDDRGDRPVTVAAGEPATATDSGDGEGPHSGTAARVELACRATNVRDDDCPYRTGGQGLEHLSGGTRSSYCTYGESGDGHCAIVPPEPGRSGDAALVSDR